MCNTQLKESAALLLNLHFLLKRQLPVTICLILRLDTFSICFDIYNEIFSLTEKAKDFGILEELFGQNTSSLESIFISVKHPFKAIRKKKKSAVVENTDLSHYAQTPECSLYMTCCTQPLLHGLIFHTNAEVTLSYISQDSSI